MNTMIFAERLREARTAAKLTQLELAKTAGVTAATISAYESTDESKRKNPSLENAVKISNALSVSLDWLCGNDSYTQLNETEALLNALMELIFTAPNVKLEDGPTYDSMITELTIDFPITCKLSEYLHKVLDLKDISDKRILPDDMMTTLKESTVNKYKGIQFIELMEDDIFDDIIGQ